MSCSRGTSDFDSFDFNNMDHVYTNQSFPCPSMNDNYPFYPIRQPWVYYAEVKTTNSTNHSANLDLPEMKPKKKKRSCFSKAFHWYSKERDLGFKNCCGKRKAPESETADLSGFASWLDLKYQDYIRERGNRGTTSNPQPFVEPAEKRTNAISNDLNGPATFTDANSGIPSSLAPGVTISSLTSCIYGRKLAKPTLCGTDKKRLVDCHCRKGGYGADSSQSSERYSEKTIEYLPCTGKEGNYWTPDVCPATLVPCSDAVQFVATHETMMVNKPFNEMCRRTVDNTTSTAGLQGPAAVTTNSSMMAGTSQIKKPSVNSISQTSQHAIEMPKKSYPLFMKIIKADKLIEEKLKVECDC